MKYSEIIKNLDENLFYLKHHNKNMTKEQDYAVDEIIDLVHELKVKILENNVKL